ncbi:LacI family DNA-binding transcriptional regulator [Microbacterium mangrovi]|uniref:LacI family DNA-binding transcriptional regulator n=1 Tax=Microbacterium mangrovi TaxID=1348253 RepID=UPI001E4F4DA9|nr:LacI family DNA-binding transcriptional regulator [Microbacterium mangrovi]
MAKLAGLSKAAVSLILNERPGTRLSDDAVARARAAAQSLGYRPNPAARSLRSGKTRTIGFISDQVTITRFASSMVRGAVRTARKDGHAVLIAETGDGPTQLTDAVQEMSDRRVDGILVGLMVARMITVPPPRHDIPVVVVNGITPDGMPSILPDEYTAGRRVANVLLDAGHRSIGFIADLPTVAVDLRRSATIARRVAGIRDALQARRVTPVESIAEGWSTELGYAEAHRMMDSHPGLTSIIAATDGVALGIYQALGERGLRIPEDVSVVSFDDEDLAALVRPALTTARLPYEDMASRGIEMLLGITEPSHLLLAMPIISRSSVSRREEN